MLVQPSKNHPRTPTFSLREDYPDRFRVCKRLLVAGLLCLHSAAALGGDLPAAEGAADQAYGNGKTPLMAAAKNGDRARVDALIKQGTDVNGANDNGGTSIMYAALSGDPETVSLLLRGDADVNAAAKNGWTALMIAAVKGHVSVAETLLAYGADPNKADIYSWTPLMRAVSEDRRRIVQVLLEHERINVNQPGENGVTALHLAVLNGDPDIVKLLLAHGADPGIEDHSGRTALDFAKQNNNLELERMITTGLTD